jgi:hypothetical protein
VSVEIDVTTFGQPKEVKLHSGQLEAVITLLLNSRQDLLQFPCSILSTQSI